MDVADLFAGRAQSFAIRFLQGSSLGMDCWDTAILPLQPAPPHRRRVEVLLKLKGHGVAARGARGR
jgi:hypothetical protein